MRYIGHFESAGNIDENWRATAATTAGTDAIIRIVITVILIALILERGTTIAKAPAKQA